VVVETVKVAEVEAAGTVTVAGRVAAGALEERATTAPPNGAGPGTTVPWTDPPPVIEVLESVRL